MSAHAEGQAILGPVVQQLCVRDGRGCRAGEGGCVADLDGEVAGKRLRDHSLCCVCRCVCKYTCASIHFSLIDIREKTERNVVNIGLNDGIIKKKLLLLTSVPINCQARKKNSDVSNWC